MTHFLTIEEVRGEKQEKVHQALRYQTDNFVWRIKFNLPLRTSTVNNKTCFVTSTSGSLLHTNIHYNATQNYIEIEPKDAYIKEQSYILHVTTQVASIQGKNLKQEVQIRFKMNP